MFASRIVSRTPHSTSRGEPKLYFERPSKDSPRMTEGIDNFGMFMICLLGVIACGIVAGLVVLVKCFLK